MHHTRLFVRLAILKHSAFRGVFLLMLIIETLRQVVLDD